jgi:fused signal recognition particle receptor
MAGVDSEALEWARQAYARLKAQQEANRQQAQASSPEPAPQEPASPEPPATLEPAAAPEPPAALEPPGVPSPGQPWQNDQPALLPQSLAPDQPDPADQRAIEAQPGAVAELPEPAKLEIGSSGSLPLPAPAQELQRPESASGAGIPAEQPAASPAPGLSLLEQAAAQRAERQREMRALAIEEPAPQVPQGAPAPAPQTPVTAADAEPQLGAFDADFTWSAEVLAAQGRRADQVSLEEIDWLGRLRRGLEKTRRNFVTQLLTNLGDDPLTPEALDELETLLLRADVGVKATDQALGALRERLNVEVVDPSEGIRFLKDQLKELLEAPIRASGSPLLAPQRDRLNVWLLVGVNGVGKTTTLGKLANLATRSGYSCLIAAADTFRAAAVEQVRVWGDRSGVTVVSNPSANADPAAVVFDAIGAAQSKGLDLVLVDTAGRLQTKHNLMEELAKVRRIVDRLAPEAAVESLLVLDASQGQNGLRQAMAFAKAAGLTGVVLTKLDGSARGGVALAVASEAGLPIRFIGAGESIRDLRPFNSFEFVEALLDG